MAALALTNARIFAGAANLSGFANSVELGGEREELESTTFASAGWRERIGGLASSSFSAEGWWEAGDATKPDDRLFTDLGAVSPVTVSPTGAVVGDVAYLTNVMYPTFSWGGQVGQLVPFSTSGLGTGTPLVRGLVTHDPTVARTTTGTGGVVQLAAGPSATQRVYGSLHVLSVAGTATPTITVTLQADNAVGFPSPVTVATFTARTAVGGEIVAGAVGAPAGDAFYRLSWVISGTTPSFTFAGAVGVA